MATVYYQPDWVLNIYDTQCTVSDNYIQLSSVPKDLIYSQPLQLSSQSSTTVIVTFSTASNDSCGGGLETSTADETGEEE